MSQYPLIDALEVRRLMAVLPVTNTNDSGPGSLRAALIVAAAGDTVDATKITGVINNVQGALGALNGVTILGSGESSLTIRGDGNSPVLLSQFGTLTIKDLTISGGENSGSGGGIYNRSNLILDNVTISNNHAFLFGGGIYSQDGDVTLINTTLTGNTAQGALEASGGALYMRGGKLTIDGSTIYNNVAMGSANGLLASGAGTGGGIYLLNTAASTITNTTLGENTAQGGTSHSAAASGTASGGAIYISSAASTTFNSCTIAYNDAVGGGSSVLQTALSQGGGIYSTGGGTVSMLNTLAAQNSAVSGMDIFSSTLTSLGNNLVGVVVGSTTLSTLLGDRFGSVLVPLAPGLSTSLADNGGDTLTYALNPTSAAINHGTPNAPTLDQRGLGRRDAADIGAFELNANHLASLAASAATYSATAGTVFSQAISATDADNDTLTYSASNMPRWMHLHNVNGQPVFSGSPTEADAGTTRVTLNAYDGFQLSSTSFKVKVGVPSIDLSDRGLLRVNGTDSADNIHVWVRGAYVRVVRNDTVKNFALSAVKAVQVYGFGGNDTITVGVNSRGVYVDAGDGNDVVRGGDGYDILSGGAGNDTLYGGRGDDRLNGNSGNDVLFGEAGNDRIFGGKGKDVIYAGGGSNTLWGEDGDDYFIAKQGSLDRIDGGDGHNTGVWDSIDSIANALLA